MRKKKQDGLFCVYYRIGKSLGRSTYKNWCPNLGWVPELVRVRVYFNKSKKRALWLYSWSNDLFIFTRGRDSVLVIWKILKARKFIVGKGRSIWPHVAVKRMQTVLLRLRETYYSSKGLFTKFDYLDRKSRKNLSFDRVEVC